jgi:hypothetical protein
MSDQPTVTLVEGDRVWYIKWCATHAMPLPVYDWCWAQPPLDGECEPIMVLVTEAILVDDMKEEQ